MKYDSIIILGTTATKKTELSLSLATKFAGEIVNSDSMQIYKELNIGTAKATSEEQNLIPHHLLDIVKPDEVFSVAKYREMTKSVVENIRQKGKLPIVVGGTGLFTQSLITNFAYGNSGECKEIREKYEQMLKDFGKEHLYGQLKKIDPEIESKVHINDTKRVIRCLEIFEQTGKTKSEQTVTNELPILHSPLIVGTYFDRELLYERINLRVDIMIKNGLVEEVKHLYDSGFAKNLQSIQAIGYKELYDHFSGLISMQEAIEIIKQNSRNYAKRQVTWFKKMLIHTWFDMNTHSVDDVVKQIEKIFNEKNK